MAELDPVKARLVGDISDLISKLQEAKKGFEETGEGAKHGQEKINDFTRAMEQAADKARDFLVEAFAVKEMFDLTTESLAALGEKQDAINGLNLALAAQGNYAKETSDELREYAENLSRGTTYSENAIMGAEKYFAVLGMNTDQIKEAIKATSDLAAMTGMDLASAQMQVGKAIETGSSRALKQYGIDVDKAGDATERLHQVVEGIESKMGGAAAAAASTYTGQMKQLKNSIEEAHASLGFFITQLATPPSGEMIGFVQRLSNFFSHDMVMGIAYVRAGISLIPASILDMVSTVESTIAAHPNFVKMFELATGQGMGAMPDAGKMAQQAKDMANSLRYGADKIIADAQAVVATGIQGTVTPTNNANPSGFHAADEGKRMEEATKLVTEAMRRMDAEGTKAYGSVAKEAAYAAAMQEGLGKTGAEYAAKEAEVDARRDEALKKLKESYDQGVEAAQKGGIATEALTADYEKNKKAIEEGAVAQHRLNEEQRDAELGSVTQSQSVKTLDDDHKSLAQSLHRVAEEEKLALEQAMAFREGLIDIAGAASGLAADLGLGGLSHVLGGVQKGMSDINKVLNAENPMQLISAGLGLAGDVVKGLKSLFGGKSEAERIGEDLGDGVSEGLVKSIEETEKKEHVSRALAEMLHASDVLKETGLTGEASKLINDEMNAVKLGAINAKEGLEDLGKAFAQLKTEADGGSVASEAAMVKMIQRSKELGETIPGVDAYVNGLMTDAAKQLKDIYSGQLPGAGGAAQNAANNSLFDSAWQGAIARSGLVGAMAQFGPALDALKKNGTPLTGAAAEAATYQGLLGNAGFSGAASGSEALGKYNKDLLDSGNMSQASLAAIETTGKTFYDQALEEASKTLDAAHAQKAALEAELPILTQLQHDQAMGLKLSPDAQAMLNEASAEGLLPALDVASQQLIMQQQIRDGVYHLAGMMVPPSGPGGSTPGGTTPGGGSNPNAPGSPNGDPGGHPTGPPEGYASGTPDVPHDMYTKIHAHEAVIPAHSNPFRGGGGGGVSHEVVMRQFAAIHASIASMPDRFASAIMSSLQFTGITR